MKNSLKHFIAGIFCVVLTVCLTVPARVADADPIRVSSYKGSTLSIGEVSGLIISPHDVNCAAVSNAPDVVGVVMVLNRWTVTAKRPGTATITVTAPDGRTGSLTITVDSASTGNSAPATQTDGPDVRQELIQLINQTRRANGAAELPVSDTLMDAAQTCSDRLYSYHHTQAECEAVAASGYPNGFGTNLTVFTNTDNIA